MRVVFVTREDPIFIPLYLEKTFQKMKDDEFFIVIMEGVPPDTKDIRYLFSLLRLYGLRDFVLKCFQLVLYRVANLWSKIKKQKRFFSVKELARFYEIPLFKTSNVNSKDFLDWLRKIKPDIVMSVTCPQIFKEELLSLPKIACLNIHTSLLPKNKSWEPVFWAMFKGEAKTGVTVHYMVRRFDSGGIIVQKSLPITKEDSWFSLNYKLAEIGGRAICEALLKIKSGDRSYKENDSKKETVNHFPSREEIMEFKKRGNSVIKIFDVFPPVNL